MASNRFTGTPYSETRTLVNTCQNRTNDKDESKVTCGDKREQWLIFYNSEYMVYK